MTHGSFLCVCDHIKCQLANKDFSFLMCCNFLYLCRHPESSKRPSFMDLSKKLSLPDSKLLLWSEEDRSVHPEADRLGGDLQCAQELYKDLQTKYLEM